MKEIGIVLSGGGVRGLAHIGVIKFMEDIGLEITHISGSSAGALVGMMYAAGVPSDEILKYFLYTNLFSVKNFSYGKPGFIDLTKYYSELLNVIQIENFKDLKKKLFVTTTNLHKGVEQVFHAGPLIKPVLASAAFPIVFSPVEIDNEWHADGGIVNNFPIENMPLPREQVVGVNLNVVFPIKKGGLKNSLDILERAFHISMEKQAVEKGMDCKVLISPEYLSAYGIFDMKKRKEIFEIGYRAAAAKRKLFLSLLE